MGILAIIMDLVGPFKSSGLCFLLQTRFRESSGWGARKERERNFGFPRRGHFVTLRVQVPNNHILTQNLYYKYYYPKPKYLIIGYMDPLGYEGNFGQRPCASQSHVR